MRNKNYILHNVKIMKCSTTLHATAKKKTKLYMNGTLHLLPNAETYKTVWTVCIPCFLLFSVNTSRNIMGYSPETISSLEQNETFFINRRYSLLHPAINLTILSIISKIPPSLLHNHTTFSNENVNWSSEVLTNFIFHSNYTGKTSKNQTIPLKATRSQGSCSSKHIRRIDEYDHQMVRSTWRWSQICFNQLQPIGTIISFSICWPRCSGWEIESLIIHVCTYTNHKTFTNLSGIYVVHRIQET